MRETGLGRFWLVWFALLAVGLATLIALGPARPANAQQAPCDVTVFDPGNQFGARSAEVASEARALAGVGAEVRVALLQTAQPAANVEQWVQRQQSQCASWRDAQGQRRNNLVVFVVSIGERQTGLYYGEEFRARLAPQEGRIRDDVMNPRFRDGDWAGGFINGMRETRRVLQPSTPGGTGAPAAPAADLSPLVPVLGGGLLLMGLFGVGIIGLIVFFVSRSRGEARKAAQQRARVARQAAANGIVELQAALRDLETQVSVAVNQLAPDEAQPLQTAYRAAADSVGNAAEAFASQGSSAGNPDQPGRSEGEYTAIEQANLAIATRISDARSQVDTVSQRARELRDAILNRDVRIRETEAKIEAAQAAARTAEQQGFKTTSITRLIGEADDELAAALALFQERRIAAGTTRLEQAQTTATRASEIAGQLETLRGQALRDADALERRLKAVVERTQRAHQTFAIIVQEHAPRSWEAVRGNGTETENEVEQAALELAQAREFVGEQTQDWDAAIQAVARGNANLDEADSHLDSIESLKQHLDRAKATAQSEIDAARTDVEAAQQFIAGKEAAVRDEVKEAVHEAASQVTQAVAALRQAPPDYALALQLSRAANAAADKALLDARSDVEADARLRARAASDLREAAAAIDIAREFISDHRRDIGQGAQRDLREADDLLKQARAVQEPARIVELAESAEERANRAYSKARQDFEAAERRRRGGGYGGWGTLRRGGGPDMGSLATGVIIGSILNGLPSGGGRRGGGGLGGGGFGGFGGGGGGGGFGGFGGGGGGGGFSGW